MMWVDYAVLIGFVVFTLWQGLRLKQAASESAEEYFLAGRKVKGWQAGVSMAATQFAADTPLLVTGLIATAGVFASWRLWIYGLAFLLMGFLLSRQWRRAGVLTDAELTLVRYSGRGQTLLRGVKGIYYGTVINCAVMAMVLIAASRIFEVFLPWHLWLPTEFYQAIVDCVAYTDVRFNSGVTPLSDEIATANNLISILCLLAFTATYATSGGLRSVIRTDVLQFVIMMVATFAYAWCAADKTGGMGELVPQIQALYGEQKSAEMLSLWPTADVLLLPFLLIISLQWLFQVNSDGTGYLAQRTMACRSDKDAQIASVTFSFLQVVVRSALWLVIGLALLVIYPFDASAPVSESIKVARETTFILGINELLPHGLKGLMLTAMIAALASTIDSHLNWGAGYWANDIYKGIYVEKIRGEQASPVQVVKVARWASLGIILIAIAVMLNLNSVQSAWQISLLFGAGTGAVLLMRWFWERVNLYSELAAIVSSLILAPVLLVYVEQDWLRLSLMSAVSVVVLIATAYLAPQTQAQTLKEFYLKVRPGGLWRNTAQLAQEDANAPLNAFKQQAKLMLLCAVSLFASLISLCCWILDYPLWHTLSFALLAIVSFVFWLPSMIHPDLHSNEQTSYE